MKLTKMVISLLVLTIIGIFFFLIQSGFTQPPPMPLPPSRPVPWGLEEIIGGMIGLYGLYRIYKMKK